MNMKKKLLMCVMAVLLVVSLIGCSSETAKGEEAKWTVEIVGAEKTAITDLDCKDLNLVEFTADLKKKDGSVIPQNWKGYKLSDIMNVLGVTDYTTVIVESDDGYSAEYTPEIVNDNETILGIEKDGESIEKPMMVPKNQRGNFWIKNTAKLTINK